MKACISYISSRTRCIEYSLKSLWDNFNCDYNYPVYVNYFDDIYDNLDLRSHITRHNEQNVIFCQVPYQTPSFLKEEELFYNRKDLWYARERFSIARKGYLHMCHYTSNMYGYPNTNLYEYDYVMTHDDEAGYTKKMPYNPFEVMEKQPYWIGAYAVNQRLKNGHPHQGHLDTRTGLWEFTRNFLKENEIVPESPVLQALLKETKAENLYHYIKWCDTYVIKTEIFRSELWNKWITAINNNGGIYKYRWGDNEIVTLFAYMSQDKIFDLKTVPEGYHDQGMFRNIQDYAPGVKDVAK